MTSSIEDNRSASGLFVRAKPRTSVLIQFELDGRIVDARSGDTLLTAMLLNGTRLRRSEFTGGDRAGFCLMGACQDCWVNLGDRRRLRACTTLVSAGMAVMTNGRIDE